MLEIEEIGIVTGVSTSSVDDSQQQASFTVHRQSGFHDHEYFEADGNRDFELASSDLMRHNFSDGCLPLNDAESEKQSSYPYVILWTRNVIFHNMDPILPMLIAGIFIGFISALAIEGFREFMHLLMRIYTHHKHLVAAAESLPLWARAIIPPIAAALAGTCLWIGQDLIRLSPGPEYMEAVRVGNGRLPFWPNIIRTISSLIVVSGGITIGREGAMVQFAALISSLFGRLVGADIPQQRLIVACGASAGFASAYHAPISGTLFVAEIIIGGLQLRELSAVLVAAVMGELTADMLFDKGALYEVGYDIPAIRLIDLVGAALLGMITGLLGSLLLWTWSYSRHYMKTYCSWLPLRMLLAGIVVGVLSLCRPEVWGNGYSVTQSLLLERWSPSDLGLVFSLRLIATTATSSASIPGGVLTPTLALGGIVGMLFSSYFWVPVVSHSFPLWVLVAMGSLLAATTHAPATSAIMMFEITRNYNVVMAAMVACVVASVVSSLLHPRSVYAEALGIREGVRRSLGTPEQIIEIEEVEES